MTTASRPVLYVAALLALAAISSCAAFEHFVYHLPPSCTRGPCAWDAVYPQFARWQNTTLAELSATAARGHVDDAVLCRDVEVLLWVPVAGLGDSLLALLTGIQVAMKTGRLFFLDWSSPHGGWALGLSRCVPSPCSPPSPNVDTLLYVRRPGVEEVWLVLTPRRHGSRGSNCVLCGF